MLTWGEHRSKLLRPALRGMVQLDVLLRMRTAWLRKRAYYTGNLGSKYEVSWKRDDEDATIVL